MLQLVGQGCEHPENNFSPPTPVGQDSNDEPAPTLVGSTQLTDTQWFKALLILRKHILVPVVNPQEMHLL